MKLTVEVKLNKINNTISDEEVYEAICGVLFGPVGLGLHSVKIGQPLIAEVNNINIKTHESVWSARS